MNQLRDQIKQIKDAAIAKAIADIDRMTLDELADYVDGEAVVFTPRLPPPRTAPLQGVPVLERITRRQAAVKDVISAIQDVLSTRTDGVNIGELRDLTGFETADLRHAVREMKAKNSITTKGEKRSTRYFQAQKKQLEIATALDKRATVPPPSAPKGQHPHVVRRPGKGAK